MAFLRGSTGRDISRDELVAAFLSWGEDASAAEQRGERLLFSADPREHAEASVDTLLGYLISNRT